MAKGRATERGTPCAPPWTKEWVALVNQAEDELDRRICGALSMDGSPCRYSNGWPFLSRGFRGQASHLGVRRQKSLPVYTMRP